ncbi:hypothetical protein CJF30_00010353 [Rutstroemia sp. NJR-2017a BBW]|nr:hypothetical protein CJF30_00010353 [Rutstroemia sp. NJR-2017a BBW]
MLRQRIDCIYMDRTFSRSTLVSDPQMLWICRVNKDTTSLFSTSTGSFPFRSVSRIDNGDTISGTNPYLYTFSTESSLRISLHPVYWSDISLIIPTDKIWVGQSFSPP